MQDDGEFSSVGVTSLPYSMNMGVEIWEAPNRGLGAVSTGLDVASFIST